LGCWISPCYGPFSLGAHFETYEPFISLIFQFLFSGHGELWITETVDIESADTGGTTVFDNKVPVRFFGAKFVR
jgi:hypothetical protein